MHFSRKTGRNYLQLGPIVGHTDHQSVRIWIRTFDDPANYTLRIQGVGLFPFISTEGGVLELRTAIALASNLRPDHQYRYQILRNGKRVYGLNGGKFRTMLELGSYSENMLVTISCNHHNEIGAWEDLAKFIEENQPRALLMLGDNVYVDRDPNVWEDHLDSSPLERRRALAEQYQKNWTREPIRQILANIPTYMIWDDHDIRDGWGSFAPDSPTLLEAFGKRKSTRDIYDRYNAYFEDARTIFWHFQMVHNPPYGQNTVLPTQELESENLVASPPSLGERKAMPFVFRCGNAAVIVLDSRGERDIWRKEYPVLGKSQWEFIRNVYENLDLKLDALIVATPVPIVGMAPDGQTQSGLGGRTDDVKLFEKGDEEGLAALADTDVEADVVYSLLADSIHSKTGYRPEWGDFKVKEIDDVRDQWSHHFSRPEQALLIRTAAEALAQNRPKNAPRRLLFVGGDWHAGGLVEVEMEEENISFPCLVTSGISQRTNGDFLISSVVDMKHEVAPGIQAKFRTVVTGYNFGLIQLIPTGATPEIIPSVIHKENASSWGITAQLPI